MPMHNSSSTKKDIDAIELIEARAKEIQFIEESIKKSNKKTMLFQRLPFYKRRRNRNYDKRKSKKFTYRKKDRHFLRTHTFYAKRFFMLKFETANFNCTDFSDASFNNSPEASCVVPNFKYNDISIPMKRRIKSSKYIYKSQDRGFLFDESFRGGFSYPTDLLVEQILKIRSESCQTSKKFCSIELLPSISQISLFSFASSIDLQKYDQVQCIENLYEVILTKEQIYIIGAWICDCSVSAHPLDGMVSIFKKEAYGFFELKNLKNLLIFPDKAGGIQTHKILCERSQMMSVFQSLSNNSIIPICLEEIYRLSYEHDQMTIYDNIKGNLFKMIENSINKEIVDKYNRTPKSKRTEICTDDLYLERDPKLKESEQNVYCIFRIEKGNTERGAFLYKENLCIGRVIRSAYKFGNGKCYGLCVIYSDCYEAIDKKESELFFDKQSNAINGNDESVNNSLLSIKNLGKNNFYRIQIVKVFK